MNVKSGYAVPQLRDGEFNGVSIAILATRWNTGVVDALVGGARRCLLEWGIAPQHIVEFRAPGAFEVPLATAKLLDSDRFDGVVALGAVIRGDTPHFDFVAGECARGLMDAQLRHGRPVGFGVLTVDNAQQALDRARADDTNKGYEAAAAVLDMIRLIRSIG